MRHILRIALFLILVYGAAACSVFPTTGRQLPVQDSAIPLSISPTTLTPQSSMVAPTGETIQTASATSVPLATSTITPVPSIASTLAPISPGNLPGLQKISQIHYAPWDLALNLTWSTDGERLAVSAGQKIHLYGGQELQEFQVLEVDTWTNSLAFAPGQNSFLALAGKDGSIQLWNIESAQRICILNAHPKGANSVVFSPDGRLLASTGNDAIVRLWEIEPAHQSGDCPEKPAAEMIGGAFAVSDIEFRPDGSAVASVDLKSIRLRETSSQRLIRTLFGETSVFDIAFRPDGKWLASAEMGGSARLWDVESGQSITTLARPADHPASPDSFLWRVAFDQDGRLLAGGSSDGLLIVWDLSAKPAQSFLLSGHHRAITGLAFNPDGRRLATCSLDGSLIVWGVK
jgi:WD40 repeat protein